MSRPFEALDKATIRLINAEGQFIFAPVAGYAEHEPGKPTIFYIDPACVVDPVPGCHVTTGYVMGNNSNWLEVASVSTPSKTSPAWKLTCKA